MCIRDRYWESVNTPLKGATLEELNAYRFPDPDLSLIHI